MQYENFILTHQILCYLCILSFPIHVPMMSYYIRHFQFTAELVSDCLKCCAEDSDDATSKVCVFVVGKSVPCVG